MSVVDWLLSRVGEVPSSSLGWFRAGVGFYNKKEYQLSIQCFHKSVELDPNNYNAYQILARACIAVNRRDEAIEALKQSVKLDNPSDWQLLVELTAQQKRQNQLASPPSQKPLSTSPVSLSTSTSSSSSLETESPESKSSAMQSEVDSKGIVQPASGTGKKKATKPK